MKKILILGLVTATLIIGGCSTKAIESQQKDRKSATNGLTREITVYSNDGTVIKKYKGTFNVENTKTGGMKFELNGKRIILDNCSTINEEQ